VKKKKEAIKKRLIERYKRNQQEAQNLSKIQSKLEKLDLNLANEIAVLRSKIDQIDREVSYHFRKYKQAEEAFHRTKKEYEKKAEEKTKLTEHLSIIIQENEKRKAKKLEELQQLLDPEGAAEAAAELAVLHPHLSSSFSSPSPPSSPPPSFRPFPASSPSSSLPDSNPSPPPLDSDSSHHSPAAHGSEDPPPLSHPFARDPKDDSQPPSSQPQREDSKEKHSPPPQHLQKKQEAVSEQKQKQKPKKFVTKKTEKVEEDPDDDDFWKTPSPRKAKPNILQSGSSLSSHQSLQTSSAKDGTKGWMGFD